MDDTKKFLDKLYLICAMWRFNSERRKPLELALKKYLLEKDEDFQLRENVAKLSETEKKLELTAANIFSIQEDALCNNIFFKDSIDYVNKRYIIYDDLFKGKFGFEIEYISAVVGLMSLYFGEKADQLNFKGEVYQFKDKEEYANLTFIEFPTNDYVKKYAEIITFTKADLLSVMNVELFPDDLLINLNKILDFFSFTIEELKKNPTLRFQEKPILKINDDSYIAITPYYLHNNLPQKYELLLKECKGYNEIRGKCFEKLALELFNKLPNSKLYPNIPYDKFELDGLLNLKESSWFIECTSHPPHINSLLGDAKNVKRDIEKTIEKCESQALRAIAHSSHPDISSLNPKDKKGIFIVLEGIYPNLNTNNAFVFAKQKENYPRYAINYFDLQEILRQPEIGLFEEFLFWRTQKNMPIVCFDEKGYWAYFTKMKRDIREVEIFEKAQQKELKIIYIDSRFNSKGYLSKIAK